MGLIVSVLGLPLLPVRGVVRLAEILKDQADQELYSMGSARAQLEATAQKRAAGELTEEEEAEAMKEVSQRMIASRTDATEMPAPSPSRQEE